MVMTPKEQMANAIVIFGVRYLMRMGQTHSKET